MPNQSSSARLLAIALLAAGMVHTPAQAQRDFSKVEIETTQLSDTLYMLHGAGGNIGVSAGADGVFLIDDQFAPLSEKILTAVRAISDAPIHFVVNTHWHGDHTGGNENMHAQGAAIIAHSNVRKRMSTRQTMAAFDRVVEPSPAAALPQLTFDEATSLHLNGEEARVQHLPFAHTDGDAFVQFTASNVVHTGDVFFNGFYPFIDAGSGGTISGVIDAVGRILEIVDVDTKIIPGHGPLATRANLEDYKAMLETVRMRVTDAMSNGTSAEELVESGAFTDIEAEWGDGFLDTQKFISVVYTGMGTG